MRNLSFLATATASVAAIAAASSLLSGCGDLTLGTNSCLLSFTTLPTTSQDLTLATTTAEIAQSFKPKSTANITSAQLRLKANATLTGSLYLLIQTDASDKPSGVSISPTATLDATKVLTTASAFYTFTFASSVPLTRDTTYWFRLKGSALSSTASVSWIGNGTNAYSDGSVRTSTDGVTWDVTVGSLLDMLFNLGC
jgi:hypothetical protein